MRPAVIDSSVIIAILLDEEGSEKVAERIVGASMSSVNLAEVVTKCIEWEIPVSVATDFLKGSQVRIVDFDTDLAIAAGELRSKASRGVLSLGDRACLATAINLGGAAVTADRVWASLALACPVEVIR